MGALVGFTGSRSLEATWSALVGQVVAAVMASGRRVAVGCQRGADALVRQAAPEALVFRATDYGQGREAFAARSQAMVKAVVVSGEGAGLVGFITGPCPSGVMPGRRWTSGETPSGSWSTLALGVGLGLPVVVFPCPSTGPSTSSGCNSGRDGWVWSPPSWPGTWACAGPGPWATGWRFIPSARQLTLF